LHIPTVVIAWRDAEKAETLRILGGKQPTLMLLPWSTLWEQRDGKEAKEGGRRRWGYISCSRERLANVRGTVPTN